MALKRASELIYCSSILSNMPTHVAWIVVALIDRSTGNGWQYPPHHYAVVVFAHCENSSLSSLSDVTDNITFQVETKVTTGII